MIIVSGEPRTGTSMTMLILDKLGLKKSGDRYSTLGPETEFNPTGLWEVPGVPFKPFNQKTIDDYNLKDHEVVKVVTHGINHPDTDWNLIDKLIYCIRDPREAMVSQQKQHGFNGDDEFNYAMYINHIHDFIWRTKWNRPNYIVVDYKDLIFHTKSKVKKIAAFLGVPYKAKAAKVINRKYYRSRIEDAPEDDLMEKAIQFYLSMKTVAI